MALNIAVPMSGVGDLLEGFGLLSPISPVSIDYRSNMKNPLSPVGSESSGVSSLDLEDIKKQMPTLLDENEDDGTSGPGKSSSNSTSLSAASTMSTTSSRTCSTSSSSSSSASDDYTNQLEENETKMAEKSSDNGAAVSTTPLTGLLGSNEKELNEPTNIIDEALLPLKMLNLPNEPSELPLFSPKTTTEHIFSLPRQSIIYNNRDILDLGSNIRSQGSGPDDFAFQFAELPVTNNIQYFLQNRSQYHRLGPNGHVQEFRMATCPCCDFQYPVNTVGANSSTASNNQTFGTSNLSNLNANQIYGNLQQQQQQQQLRLQQQQLQMQYAYRSNNGSGNSVGRDYNMYQQTTSGIGGNGNAGGLQSSRFNNGVYGSGNASGGPLPNMQNAIAGSAASGGFFNNNTMSNNLLGRDQFNHMAPMGMQYNNMGATSKGISQSNSASSQSSGLRQQQQYEMIQQQKQYVSGYSLGSAGTISVTMTASANTALRLQQQQSQQASHYYKKGSSMRYGGGPAGVNNMPSGGLTGSNWKNPMTNNNTIQDTATKLIMELNKMQQPSPYNVPFQ